MHDDTLLDENIINMDEGEEEMDEEEEKEGDTDEEEMEMGGDFEDEEV